jgi:hypothetical protein
VTGSLAAESTVRVTATQMVLELKHQRWADGRIVSGAECVNNGGVFRSATSQVYSTRFVCLVQSWRKPVPVSPVLWSRLETAFETGDVAAVYKLLGLPLNATRAQVNAASDRVLGRNTPSAVGTVAIDATHWKLEPSPISTSWFNRALNARHTLLGVVAAMEAWYADHQTYAGATAARLRVAPYNTPVPSNVRIVATLANDYCVEATAGATTWSDRGPGGVPAVARCH